MTWRCGIIAAVAIVGCGGSDRSAGAGTHAGGLPPGVTRSPDGAGYCCAVEAPSCDCAATGGFTTDPAECWRFNVCDAHPDDWRRVTDEHGCRFYETWPITTCCHCPPDAGVDAGALPPGVTPSPDGAGYCCPPGVPSCDCTSTGGFTIDPAVCEWGYRICDAHPSDWHLETDAHGCMAYSTTMDFCCNCPDAGPEGDAG